MFKKSHPTASQENYYSINITPEFSEGKTVTLKPGEVVVQRDDHYLPARRSVDVLDWYLGTPRSTYKRAYEKHDYRVKELESFLADLLILDPSLEDRFNKPFEGDDENRPGFEWDFLGAHAAADVLRSDVEEAEKRAAVKKFQGKK